MWTRVKSFLLVLREERMKSADNLLWSIELFLLLLCPQGHEAGETQSSCATDSFFKYISLDESEKM